MKNYVLTLLLAVLVVLAGITLRRSVTAGNTSTVPGSQVIAFGSSPVPMPPNFGSSPVPIPPSSRSAQTR